MNARSPLAGIFTGVAAMIAVAAAVALAIGVAQYTGFLLDAERHRKVLDLPSPWLPEVRAKEATELGGYRWVDRKAGVIAIPIDRALELTLAERSLP